MRTKLNQLIAILVCVLFIVPCAKADFRKAIDFYIARNGNSLMKEVSESVKNNQSEGLLLFLHAIQIDNGTSIKSNLYEGFKDQRQTTSTLKTILSESQQLELRENLSTIVSQSNVDVQYYFAAFVQSSFQKILPDEQRKIQYDFISKSSYLATSWGENMLPKAELGEPSSQFIIGLKYLNFNEYLGYGCDAEFKDPICQSKDEAKGYAFLKQALKKYESSGHDDLNVYANAICELFQKTSNGDKSKLRQAYLWCITAQNSGSIYAWKKLEELELADLGDDFPTIKGKLPDWVIEVRKQVLQEGAPVFSYYFDDYMDFELDVYANGDIKVGVGFLNKGFPGNSFGTVSFLDVGKDIWLKVKPKKVKEFLAEFVKMTDDWKVIYRNIGFCDWPDQSDCMPKKYQATIRDGINYRRYYFAGLVWDIAKINRSKIEYDTTIKIGKVSALVEKYFPTQKLRCGLGNSPEYNQACVDRDKRWASLPN